MNEADTNTKTILDLIDSEIASGEDCLRPITLNLVKRIEVLVADIEVDLNAPIDDASDQ